MKQTLSLLCSIVLGTGLAVAQDTLAISLDSMPPSVVKTVPQAGDDNVDPGVKEIRVTFSKEMVTDRMWSFCQISDDTFPKRREGQEIGYLPDKRTCVMPVELEPEKTYVIWFNRGRFNSFRDTDNHPAVSYLLVFRTGKAR